MYMTNIEIVKLIFSMPFLNARYYFFVIFFLRALAHWRLDAFGYELDT